MGAKPGLTSSSAVQGSFLTSQFPHLYHGAGQQLTHADHTAEQLQ